MNRSVNRRDFLKISGSAFVGALLAGYNASGVLEKRRIDNMPPASRLMKPNVLLIVMDTVRAQSLSIYGYDRQTTPNLERFADTGILFSMAISQAPWTLPSHASMFTGRLPFDLIDGWWKPLGNKYPTLAEVLSGQGYMTAGFIANKLYCSRTYGLDRGFVHYEDYRLSAGEAANSTYLGRKLIDLSRHVGYQEIPGRKTASMLNKDFLNWLDKRDPSRPFFAFLNYFDAHVPYLPPLEFALKFSPGKRPRGHFHEGESLDAETIRELNDAYDGAISYLDYQLGKLFEELQAKKLLDNTLVIVTSDHGEQFGEHDLVSHGNSLFKQLLHVPLIISLPRSIPRGMIISEPVGLDDIPATVIDLVDAKAGCEIPRVSLARFWNNTDTHIGSNYILSEVHRNTNLPPSPVKTGSLRSILLGKFHYIKNYGNGRERLFDIESDPLEEVDLIEARKYHGILQECRSYLES